jgi:hypothetical protein
MGPLTERTNIEMEDHVIHQMFGSRFTSPTDRMLLQLSTHNPAFDVKRVIERRLSEYQTLYPKITNVITDLFCELSEFEDGDWQVRFSKPLPLSVFLNVVLWMQDEYDDASVLATAEVSFQEEKHLLRPCPCGGCEIRLDWNGRCVEYDFIRKYVIDSYDAKFKASPRVRDDKTLKEGMPLRIPFIYSQEDFC